MNRARSDTRTTSSRKPRDRNTPANGNWRLNHAEANLGIEQSAIGALMLGAKWNDVGSIMRPEDYSPKHALIIRAIERLAVEGNAHDPLTVAEELERRDQLRAAGGSAYLSQIARETPSADNIATYVRAVRENAIKKDLPDGYRDPEGIGKLKRAIVELEALHAPASPLSLRHVADIVKEHREAEWLNGLHKILERYVIAVLAGFRGALKSFVALHWQMLAAINGETVVALSGEGGGFGRRAEAWMRRHAPAKNLSDLRLLVLERAVNLNLPETLTDLRQAIDAARITPALVTIDTLSKFTPGLKENASEEMAAFLYSLSAALRDHYGSSILIVAHTGHGEAKRPRGSSVLMCNPDAEYFVERPDPTAMACTVSRERFKDSPPLPRLAYAAEVIDLGYLDRYQERVTSLALADTEAPEPSAPQRTELRGKAQRQLLAALRARSGDGAGVWTSGDMREIARLAGMSKSTARSAVDALTTSPHLKPATGGWSLAL